MDTSQVTIHFRGRKFRASADHIDEYRPHVYRIDVPPLSPAWLHLEDLLGTYIPRFLDEATVYSDAGRTPALLLEYVRGTSLHALPIKRLLWDALKRTYGKLTERGVLHGDAKLDNFLLCDGGVLVAVDFEFARSLPLPSSETNEEGLISLISLIQTYARDAARRRRQRRNLRAKGLKFWERADMFCSSTSNDGTETD